VTKTKASKGRVKIRSTAKAGVQAKKKPARKEARKAKPRAQIAKSGSARSAGAKSARARSGAKSGGVKSGAKVARERRELAGILPTARPADERGRRDSLATAKAAVAAALDKKAVEPVLIDVCGLASYADFIVVVSGRSDRQVDAIAEGVCQAMAGLGRRPIGREGARNGRWVLIDFGDVVMHVFYHPLREVFDIESLWIDAPRVKLHVPAEARADAAPGRDSYS
jgi:ribosome-associated protein